MGTYVLLSGGIDSMVVLHLLAEDGRSAVAINVDYGQPARHQEWAAANAIAQQYGARIEQVSVRFPRRFGPGEIRFRNGFLIFVAAMLSSQGEALDLAIGVHAGVPYPDCSQQFIASISGSLASSVIDKARVVAPLKTWTKAEILAYAVNRRLPIHLTYSCEAGTTPPCGKCRSCLDRLTIDALRAPRI